MGVTLLLWEIGSDVQRNRYEQVDPQAIEPRRLGVLEGRGRV